MKLFDLLTRKREPKDYECNSKDIILAQNRYLSFDRMKTRRNSSIFAYAASSSSILKSLIEPNILQGNASFIVPDCGNHLSRKYKDFLKGKGYAVKIVDFCFNLTDTSNIQTHYNPFCYIQENADIFYLVDTIIEKTGFYKKESDKHFSDCEKGLLTALFLSTWKYHSIEEQTFDTVLKLLKAAGNDFIELDKYFDDILKKDKDSSAVAFYKAFREAANLEPWTEKIVISLATRLQILHMSTAKKLTSRDTLDLNKIFTEKTAIFINLSADISSFNLLAPVLYQQVLTMMVRNPERAQDIHCILYMNQDVIADSFAYLFNIIDTNRNSVIFTVDNIRDTRHMDCSALATIRHNCDTRIAYNITDLKPLAEYIGEPVKSMSNEAIRTLVKNITTMQDDECIVKIRGYKAFKAKKHNAY